MTCETIRLNPQITVTAECTREIQATTKIDGCEYSIAPKTYEYYNLSVKSDGALIASIGTFDFVDRVGHVQFKLGSLARVKEMISRVLSDSTTPEWAELKHDEEAKAERNLRELEEFERNDATCPTCGGYCYGDCE
jgi:hypothetical protein